MRENSKVQPDVYKMLLFYLICGGGLRVLCEHGLTSSLLEGHTQELRVDICVQELPRPLPGPRPAAPSFAGPPMSVSPRKLAGGARV